MSSNKEKAFIAGLITIPTIVFGGSGLYIGAHEQVVTQADISHGKAIAKEIPASCLVKSNKPSCLPYSSNDISDVKDWQEVKAHLGDIKIYPSEQAGHSHNERELASYLASAGLIIGSTCVYEKVHKGFNYKPGYIQD